MTWGQPLGHHRLVRKLVGQDHLVRRALVAPNLLVDLQGVLILGAEDLLGPIRVLAIVVLEPGELGLPCVLLAQSGSDLVPVPLHLAITDMSDQLVVFPGHGSVVEVNHLLCIHRAGRRVRPLSHRNAVLFVRFDRLSHLPAIGTIPIGYDELTVFAPESLIESDLELRAQKIKVAAVSGEQLSALDADVDPVEHDVGSP